MNQDKALELWKIPNRNEIKLHKEAANFYLLKDLSIELGYDLDLFKEKEDFLADIFEKYLSMVIGGELRHCESIRNSISKNTMALWDFIKPLEKDMRNDCWYEWGTFYLNISHKEKIRVLITARRFFWGGSWRKQYGGISWKKICDLLIDYKKGSISKTTFVDTTFSIHHNGNYVTDKIWDVSFLNRVLDSAFEGDIKALKVDASPDICNKYTLMKMALNRNGE